MYICFYVIMKVVIFNLVVQKHQKFLKTKINMANGNERAKNSYLEILTSLKYISNLFFASRVATFINNNCLKTFSDFRFIHTSLKISPPPHLSNSEVICFGFRM